MTMCCPYVQSSPRLLLHVLQFTDHKLNSIQQSNKLSEFARKIHAFIGSSKIILFYPLETHTLSTAQLI